eukprot:Gb_37570 [translate_table: standard]
MKLYIVYLGEVPSNIEDFKTAAAKTHHDLLVSVLGSHDAAEESLIYSYGKSLNGFAATLSPSEAQQISKMPGVVSAFENKKKKLHTTRTWDFMGFPQSVQRNLQYESEVIVAILDTGIWPESESFDDTGFGPIPSKWKGKCQTTSDFKACNEKLIGASFYNKGIEASTSKDLGKNNFTSPIDSQGHGTHTASIIAGNVVKNVSLVGLAQGDARGGVPGARIAAYKVCWDEGCSDLDVLAAFDDAIYDGVDVISISLGYDNATADYFEDVIAIGSFHAMKKGILTSNSAGNVGPGRGTLTNASPWSLTVAGSSIDRQFHSQVILGNNQSFTGVAINTFSMEKPWYPLIYGGDAPNTSAGFSSDVASTCILNSLDRQKVEGKIVLCGYVSEDQRPDKGVFMSGGAGVIITVDGATDTAFPFMIPATWIPIMQGEEVKSYIKSTGSPVAIILKTDTTNDLPAPVIASFSARGPNPITQSLLKPDITAPGIDIFAAWSNVSSVSQPPEDKRFVNFNIMSGTSMACPHAAGAAAYIKSFHPDWSPAAIKSALMTTAYPLDANAAGNEDAELGYGSGHINPMKAIDPGLIYDVEADSYISMLCSEGYNTTTLRIVTGDNSTCSNISEHGVGALNYPSMMIVAKEGNPISGTFLRRVTNVGSPQSTYMAAVNTPSGLNITVKPNTLSFTSTNQTISFIVTITGEAITSDTLLSGSLTWSSGNYSVRSPIVAYCNPDFTIA